MFDLYCIVWLQSDHELHYTCSCKYNYSELVQCPSGDNYYAREHRACCNLDDATFPALLHCWCILAKTELILPVDISPQSFRTLTTADNSEYI